MKRLAIIFTLATALTAAADVRLPEYNQVAGVSNQVSANATAIANVDAKVSALSPSTTYPQTARMTFTLAGEMPSGSVAQEMLADAFIKLTVGNNVTRYPLSTLTVGTTVSTIVSVTGAQKAFVDFSCPTICTEQYLCTRQFIMVRDGGNYAVTLTLRKADSDLFAIGRAQRISDTTTMSSFLVTRDCSSTNNYAPVTLHGYFYVTNGVRTWVNETGVNDGHPTITGDTIEGTQGDFETRIFPWAQAEKRTVYVNFTDANYGNDYHFTWIPMYYWKLEDVDLECREYTFETGVWTTNKIPHRIHWISKTKLPGFDIPPWGYIHAYENGVWTTKGVKDGFYYARYDSVTQNSRARSKAFAAKDTQYTRASITQMAHALNAYSCTVSGAATNLAYGVDDSNRLWAPPMYENYAPFRELAYIQFGASMKSTFYGGNWVQQDVLETAFDTAGANIKSFVIGGENAGSFAWLYIVNPFYGSEGSVMADASYVANYVSDGVKQGEWYVCPDRAADIGGATTVEALVAAGAFKLSYTYQNTGNGKTNMESARCIDLSSDQSKIYWFPGATTDKCCVRVTDENGWYGGFPSTIGASVYGNWLSLDRGSAARLGLWYVSASYAPSYSVARSWGSRLSFAPLRP